MHYRIWCSALFVMAVVVWSWDANCVHCESYCSTVSNCVHCESYCSTVSNNNFHSADSSRPSSIQPQLSQPVQNTICGSAQSCSPDDGHNDARNMLR